MSKEIEVTCVHCSRVYKIPEKEIRTPYYCWICR